jgi:DNA-binding transcriptional LysR family regulator
MIPSELDWNDIPLLLALARSGSMSAAARSLGIDVSTVSRRVAAAETALQTPLFIRSHRGYQPTDAGAVFIARAEQVQGEVQALVLETRAEAEGIRGPVRITAVDALFDYWLVERLPALLQRQPDLQLRLIADDGNLSFTRREADLALRLARPTRDAALVMRKLGDIDMAVFAGAQYAPIRREQWGEQPWLTYGDELSGVPEMQWLARMNPAPNRVVQVSSATTLVRACEAGLGLALLPGFVGTAVGLRRLSDAAELHRELWLLSHRDATSIKRFRVVADWLHQAFEADRQALSE